MDARSLVAVLWSLADKLPNPGIRASFPAGGTSRDARATPGPKGLGNVLAALRFQRDPLAFLERASQSYGDVTRLQLGPVTAMIVHHPRHVQQVLVERASLYGKPSRVKRVLAPLVGEGMFTSEGEMWRSQRRVAQPLFTRAALSDTLPIVNDASQLFVERLALHSRNGRVVDLSLEATRFAMHVAARAFLGIDVEEADDLALQVRKGSRFVAKQLLGLVPLPESLPTPGARAYREVIRRVHGVCQRLIDRRRAEPPRDDYVGQVLCAVHPRTGTPFSDREIRHQLSTMFMAGYDTTANALSWMFYLLARDRNAATRVREEARAVLDGRPPSTGDFVNLVQTMRVIEESNRLYPNAWIILREALKEDEFDSYPVPKGALVFIATWLTHRDPRWWERPADFEPDRFSPERSVGQVKGAYYPFGAGQRICIGEPIPARPQKGCDHLCCGQRRRVDRNASGRRGPPAQLHLRLGPRRRLAWRQQQGKIGILQELLQ